MSSSIQTFKALSVVTNVKQGELIKKLIEENNKLKKIEKLWNERKEKEELVQERNEEFLEDNSMSICEECFAITHDDLPEFEECECCE
tara:strand:- start:412 stop:675 length:264 start_codon:yes stop_codon:yes gene_type:complete